MSALKALWKVYLLTTLADCVQWTDTSVHFLELEVPQSPWDCNSHATSYQDPGVLTWAQPDWGPKSPGLQRSQSLQSAPKVPLHLESAEEVPLGLTSRGNGTCTKVSQDPIYLGTFLETPLEENLYQSQWFHQCQPNASDLKHVKTLKQPHRLCYLQCAVIGRPKTGGNSPSTHKIPNYHCMFSVHAQHSEWPFQQGRLHSVCFTGNQKAGWYRTWWSHDRSTPKTAEKGTHQNVRNYTIIGTWSSVQELENRPYHCLCLHAWRSSRLGTESGNMAGNENLSQTGTTKMHEHCRNRCQRTHRQGVPDTCTTIPGSQRAYQLDRQRQTTAEDCCKLSTTQKCAQQAH